MRDDRGEERAGPCILIVDDEPASVSVLEEILRDAGYRPRTVDSGAKALRAVAEEKPDLILLDIVMPDMDGYEVCERLRSDPETERIPVIMASGHYIDSSARVKGFRSGASDYLLKPVDRDELLVRIETQLRFRDLEDQHLLEEKLALIDQVVTTLHHEIINPLSGILGYSEILMRQMRRRRVAPEEIEKALANIRDCSERIREVMDKLKDITHPVESEFASGTTMIDVEQSTKSTVSIDAEDSSADEPEKH